MSNFISFQQLLGLSQEELAQLQKQRDEQLSKLQQSATSALSQAGTDATWQSTQGQEAQVSGVGSYGDYLQARTAYADAQQAAQRGEWRPSGGGFLDSLLSGALKGPTSGPDWAGMEAGWQDRARRNALQALADKQRSEAEAAAAAQRQGEADYNAGVAADTAAMRSRQRQYGAGGRWDSTGGANEAAGTSGRAGAGGRRTDQGSLNVDPWVGHRWG
jgi:hypothetical protein